MTRLLYTLIITATLLATSCGKKAADTNAPDMQNADTMSTEIYVDVTTLHNQTFHRQLVCNGKLKATAKCDLAFDNATFARCITSSGTFDVIPS